MKYSIFLIIIIVTVFFCSCDQPTEKSNVDEKSAPSLEQQEEIPEHVDDDFGLFIETFNNNRTFQLNRVSFPLEAELLDENLDVVHKSILKPEYRSLMLSLEETKDYEVRYTMLEKVIHLEYTGKENGINYAYTFNKVDGKWNLVKLVDLST